MESHEVIREAADRIGVKALAAALKLSPAMVYKWCEEATEDDPDASGTRNPLDRVREIVRATGSREVVNWLCHQAGGFFVANPPARKTDIDADLLQNTQKLVGEFSQLLLTVTRSIEDDGQIRPEEADRIRRAWERLKSSAETFAVAAEKGMYREG